MKQVALGATDLQISAVAFGCLQLAPDRAREGKEAVRRALELGINFFDTAEVYGRGQSETILGRALRESGVNRENVVIATKCGVLFKGMHKGYTYSHYDLSPSYMKAACEGSLKRLSVDYVDLYQTHRIDYLSHPEETARALEDLKAEGKIRHAGVSNYDVDEIRALAAHTRIESLQTRFSLVHPEPLGNGLAAVCWQHRMSILCYWALHRGVLTGKKELAHSDREVQREQGILAQLEPFARKYGATVGQLSLAWLVQMPDVVPLVGTANADHIAEAATAVDIMLAREDWYELLVIARGAALF